MSKTIIERMCTISEKMRPSEDSSVMPMSNSMKARTEIRALCKTLDMTPTQVIIMTAIVKKSSRYHIGGDDIADMLGIEYIKFLTYNKDLEALKKRGYIRLDSDGDIVIPKEVLNSLKNDKPILPEPMEGLDAGQLLSRLRKILQMRDDDMCSTQEAVDDLKNLFKLNPGNSVSDFCNEHSWFVYKDLMLLYILICKFYHNEDDMIGVRDIEDYYTNDELDIVRGWIRRETTALQQEGLMEFTSDDGLISKDYVHLKDEVKEKIFEDVGGFKPREKRVRASHRKEASSIAPKELFYNPTEQRQVDQLRALMSEERFGMIRSKMKEQNLRTGFTCLFYGSPGTGKTETVYQIARESGRELFIVDVSQIKSCWVGESEKNIKSVFSKYRECVSAGGTVPILLFNEADAIFGVRSEGAGTAVDKMENSIQNIILQEMEDLDGILIATTNLTANLDKAFERRFLYKIRFDKPGIEARSRIWRMMIPELSEMQAQQLAADFDFSGGQIENISRKKTVKALISGEPASYEQIREYCSEETIGETHQVRKIGF